MKEYDIVVVGSGCGVIIVEEAMSHGMKVALVDKGPAGGTCLNVGCIPSKMLIYSADTVMEVEAAKKVGVAAEIKMVDFPAIMERMRKTIRTEREELRHSLTHTEGLDYYGGEAHFIADYILEVNGETIKGEKIFLAAGSRPSVPPLKGLDTVHYLNNETVLGLKSRPESLIIIGGGYIGVEYGHFFAAMGTKVSIVERDDRLIRFEEPEISAALEAELSRRLNIYTNARIVAVSGDERSVTVELTVNKEPRKITADRILMATGRGSNADLLKTENTGVELDKKGFIQVNDYFETTKKNIFAVGDIIGRAMFTHAANREALIAISNVLHNQQAKMDYNVIPHSVYSYPQVASVGLTEAEARKSHNILVGKAKYYDVARGQAMLETEGFTKVIVDKDNENILGFHIFGPGAPELIQEVVNAMATNGHAGEIGEGIHIHPALSELIPATLNRLEEV